MDVEAIQEGMAAAARTIKGLRAAPSIPDAINPPIFCPTELDITYDLTFAGGAVGLTGTLFSAGVYTSRGDSPTGRKLLVAYMSPDGPTSIKAAIEADRTLDGACKTLIVQRVRGAYRLYNIGGTDYLGATLDIQVWA